MKIAGKIEYYLDEWVSSFKYLSPIHEFKVIIKDLQFHLLNDKKLT